MKIEYSFPIGVRLWRWWCKKGPKDQSGGTIGGSFFLRRLRDFYSVFPKQLARRSRVRICGKRDLYIDALDLRTFQMVLPKLENDDPELHLAGSLTPPGGVFVDIGANVGLLSLLALSGSVDAVYSFEPNPEMMARMRLTRSISPFAKRWQLFECAVGATNDRAKLYVDRHFSGTASLVDAWQKPGQQAMEVSVVALDNWVEKERPRSFDVLKIDVEGWEFAVLEGARDTLRQYQPFVWFEHNLPVLKRSGLDADRVLDMLQNLSYTAFYNIGLLPYHGSMSLDDVKAIANRRVNLLAVPNSRSYDFAHRVLHRLRSDVDEQDAR